MVSYNNQINDICTSVTTLLLHCLRTVHTGRGQHRNDLNYLTLNQNTQSIWSLSQRELSPPDCAIKVMKYHLTFLKSKYSWRVLVSFFSITPYLGQLITEWNKSLKDIFPSHETFFFLVKLRSPSHLLHFKHQNEKITRTSTTKCSGEQKEVHKDVTIKPQAGAIYLPSISVAQSKKKFWKVSTNSRNFLPLHL